jgi:hypothetical protein
MSGIAESIRRALGGHKCDASELAEGHRIFREQVHDNRNVRTASVKMAMDFDRATDRALGVAQSVVRILEATRRETDR